MADVLIDLDHVAAPEASRTSPDPVMRRRTGLLLVTVVLLGLLAGGVHREPPAPPVLVPARLGDMTYVSADRLFVVTSGTELHDSPATSKIITTYALPTGRRLARTTLAVPGPIYNVVEAGPVTLVSYQVENDRVEETAAVRTNVGQVLWRRPVRLLAASANDRLVLLRENLPEVGNLRWYGVDLFTGALRWSLRQPIPGLTVEGDLRDGFPRLLITATYAGAIEVRDVHTGAVVATATVPMRSQRHGADVPIWPSGDLLLVGAPTGTTAYHLPTLTERWHSGVDLAGHWVQPACGGDICALSLQGGLSLLDRDTGVTRWADDRWSSADQAGRYLLTMNHVDPRSASTSVTSVVDPRTGRVLGDFGAWHAMGAAAADGSVIGTQEHLADDAVWYARLDPATQGVRVLGMARGVSGDCQTTPDVLVCRRIDASVGIWSLT